MRKPIIAGNWKMNKNIKEALEFVKEVGSRADRDDVEAVICAPFLQLKDLKEATKGTKIKVGAQNMHFETSGAFTGEVSAEMLQEIGMDYVIIGHSERREYFGETDETVNKKVLKALQIGINPILCCGETLEQREAGVTKDHVKTQILAGLKDVTNEDLVKVVVASVYGDLANEVRIQYGGSVKPANVAEIMGQSDIDGALVGGASLKADDYVALVNFK